MKMPEQPKLASKTTRQGQGRGQKTSAVASHPPSVVATVDIKLQPFKVEALNGGPIRGWSFPPPDYDAAFHERRNPVFAWLAIEDCLATGKPLPAWINAYLLSAAKMITDFADRVPNGDASVAIARALGFAKGRGKRNLFREANRLGHERLTALAVYEAFEEQKWKQRQGAVGESTHKQREIFKAAAKRHNDKCGCGQTIEWQTVERLYRKHAHSLKITDLLR